MKYSLATLLILAPLAPNFALAGSGEPTLFCNVTEYLGSSYHPDPEDSSGGSRYEVMKTRVWYFDELQKGVEVDSETVAGLRIKLSTYEAVRDPNQKEVILFGLAGSVEDAQTGSYTWANNLFSKVGEEQAPRLGSFLTLRRANRDLIEIACVNRH